MIQRFVAISGFAALLAACGQSAPEQPAAPSPAASSSQATTEGTPATVAQADPEAQPSSLEAKGRTLFARCAACHSIEAGKNGIGPSLHGIVGRGSASLAGYAYSPAMQAANLTWDDTTLSAYLQNPQTRIPGNKMAFAGLNSAEDRDAVIAYLKTLQ